MASFFAYIDHYKVFPESPLDKQFARVAKLASMAPRLLREAHAVEENVGQAQSLNRATWTIWGGQYGRVERGGSEQEECGWQTSEKPTFRAGDAATSGWEVPKRTCYTLTGEIFPDCVAMDTRPAALPVDQGE